MKNLQLWIVPILLFALSSCDGTRTPSVTTDAQAARLVQEELSLKGPVTARSLEGGLSGHAQLFLVTGGENKYVLRIVAKPEEDVAHEFTCLQIASSAGYGPHIYASDPTRRFVIMEYMQRYPITLQDRRSDTFYQALGEVISKMHHGPAFPKWHSIFVDIQHDLARLKKYESYKAAGEEMEQMVSMIHTILSPGAPNAPCHNDLNPNNTIWEGSSFRIIDYEDASEDDPFFDLASVVMFNCFDSQHEEILLRAYFGRPMTTEEGARLYLSKQEAFLCYATRLFLKNPDLPQDWSTKPEPYSELFRKIGQKEVDLSVPTTQFRFGLSLLKQVKENIRSQEFREAVDLLSKRPIV